MTTYRSLPFLLFALLLGCTTTKPAAPEATYGASFEAGSQVLKSEDLLNRYSGEELEEGVVTTLSGTVTEVCQAKGCWMTLPTGTDELMMVKFKDYAFFVPKDIAEREVVLHGRAYYQITDVEELRHYARDAGMPEAEVATITEPRRELRFLADGVQLM